MRKSSLCVCVLALLALVACSNAKTASKADVDKYGTKTAVSGSPVPSKSAPPTAAEAREAWLTAANDECGALNNDLVGLSATPPTTQAAALAYLDRIKNGLAAFETRLRRIPGTFGTSREAKTFIDGVHAAIALFSKAIDALKANDVAAAGAAMTAAVESSQQVDDLATSLGITSCVLPGG